MENMLLYLFIFLIEGFIAYFYYEHIFHNASTRYKGMYYLLFYTLLCLIFLFHSIKLNSFSYLILNFLLASVVYRCPIYTNMFFTGLLWSIMNMTELIAELTLGDTMFKYNNIAVVPVLPRFLFIASSKSLFLLLVLIIVRIYNHSHRDSIYHNSNYYSIIFVSFISCIIFDFQFYLCSANDLTRPSEIIVLFITCTIVFINIFLVWLFDYNQAQQDEITNLKLNAQRAEDALQYSTLIEQQDENQKILIHDIKKHLLTIYDLNKDKQYEQTNKYIQDLLGSSAISRIHKPTSCHLFNLLMARYASICDEKAIDFVLDAKDVDLRFLDAEDITSLFCNLMDNAIDAATGTKTPKIELRLSGNDYRSHTVITMINSCDKDPVRTANNKFLTQKSNKQIHGFGTRSIERVVKKYDGNIEMYYQQDEQEFHTILLLKNDNKSA